MSKRQWIYDVLTQDSGLSPITGERVIQGESLTTVNITKPYLVYRVGNDTDEGMGEDEIQPSRTFFQVYIHDEPGDYDGIDALVILIKTAFRHAANSPTDHIITVRYLETSRDLSDAILGTIFRYMRFQLIIS